MKTRLLCLAAVLLVALSATAEEWNRSFAVGSHPQLRVEAGEASIHVSGAAGNTIVARVVANGWHIGPDGLQVTAQQSGDQVTLRVKAPERHFHFGFDRSVSIEISVPQASSVNLASSDGSVSLSGVKGDARLLTSDGSVRVEGFDGSLHAHTSDGSIQASGRFELLDLSTSDGSIRAEIQPGSRMTGEWSLRTSDGSVNLALPADLAANLDAWTGDGHIDLQLPVQVSGRVERHRVRGSLHGGGPALQVHTGDGSIVLRSL